MPRRLALLLLLTATCLACSTMRAPREEPAGRTDRAARPEGEALADAPWTKTFMTPAVLVAREVRIEGPPGLLAHVAIAVDANVHDYKVETVPEGLLQVVVLKPEAEGALIRCTLDGLAVVAEVELRVLERPGPTPVRIEASGDAVWRTPEGQEQRGALLRLEGQVPE